MTHTIWSATRVWSMERIGEHRKEGWAWEGVRGPATYIGSLHIQVVYTGVTI